MCALQDSRGFWTDFHQYAGGSTEWIAGYVGNMLLATTNLRRVAPFSLDTVILKAADWLVSAQHPGGGWGYNEAVPVDVDSTSTCLLFLHSTTTSDKFIECLANSLSHVVGNQDSGNSGFATYNLTDIQSARSRQSGASGFPLRLLQPFVAKIYSGWCSPEPYVTAVAAHFLITVDKRQHSERVVRALDYIESEQTRHGYWNSYWCNSQTFVTAACIRSLSVDNSKEEAVQKAMNWILKEQKGNGAWECKALGKMTPLETASAILGLLIKTPNVSHAKICDGIKYLLGVQRSDGSWESQPCMSVPKPWESKDFTQEEYKHPRLVLTDDERIFTTATVLRALLRCLELAGPLEIRDL